MTWTETDKGDWLELRKLIRGTHVLIIVGLEGWDYQNNEKRVLPSNRKTQSGWPYITITKDFNVRISLNGPGIFTWDEWNDLHQAVFQARLKLTKREEEID